MVMSGRDRVTPRGMTSWNSLGGCILPSLSRENLRQLRQQDPCISGMEGEVEEQELSDAQGEADFRALWKQRDID